MAFIASDRVRESNNITGTGPVSLGNPVINYRSFSSQMNIGDTTWYALVDTFAEQWEVGIGTYSNSNVLTRTTVLSSSNAGSLVNFTGNTCDCFMDLPSEVFTGSTPIPFAVINQIQSNNISITNTTASISSTTGALIVTGGIGIGGNLFIGSTGNIGVGTSSIVSGNAVAIYGGNLFVARSVGIGGNLTISGQISTVSGVSPLLINANTSAPDTWPTGTVVQIIGTTSSVTGLLLDGIGGFPVIYGRRADGTVQAPTHVLAGEILLEIGTLGFSSGSGGSYTTVPSSSIIFKATDNWTVTDTSSQIQFQVTPSGTVSPITPFYIQNSGDITIGSGTDNTGSLQVTGGTYTDSLVIYGATQTGGLSITNTTVSTSSSTGALTVAGGAGIAGNINVGGKITLPSSGVWTSASPSGAPISEIATWTGTPINLGAPAPLGALFNVVDNMNASATGGACIINAYMQGGASQKGGMYAILGTVNINTTSANNITAPYNAGLFTTSGFVNDNGSNITALGHVVGVSSTAQLITAATYYSALYSGEFAIQCQTNCSVQHKHGTVNVLLSTDAVRGYGLDAAEFITSQYSPGANNGWKYGTVYGGWPDSSELYFPIGQDGTIIAAIPGFNDSNLTVANLIDFSAIKNVSSYILNTTNVKITGSGNIITSGNLTICNTTPSTSSSTGALTVAGGAGIAGNLYLATGTSSIAPIIIPTALQLMTAATTGAIENDGNVIYTTSDTISGRGYIPTTHVLRYVANAAATGTSTSFTPYFGASSNITLAPNSAYEFEYNLWFVKTTAGTVTFQINLSNNAANLNAWYIGSNPAGLSGVNNDETAGIVTGQATMNLPASNSMVTATNQYYKINGIIESNITLSSTFCLFFKPSAGTITPQRGSYFKITRLPSGSSGNVGIFS